MPEPNPPHRLNVSIAVFLFAGLAGLLLSINLDPPNLVGLNGVLDFAAGPGGSMESFKSRPQVEPDIITISQAHRITEEDVDSLLVTETNPARSDGTMDYARCAALHNYIVQYGWLADDRSLTDLPRTTYWEANSEESEASERHVDPALKEFFKLVIDNQDISFHFWVYGLFGPKHMFESPSSFPENLEGEPDRVVTLYAANGMEGHSAGLMYDQERHQAYYAMTIWEYDSASPIDEHHDLWHPLETVLSNWIEMIRIGRITASRDEAPNEKNDVWAMHSYGPRQVGSAVESFHRLVDAIEARMPADALLPGEQGPLLTDRDLDAASVPAECFIRSFLTRVRKPRFKKIAPGLIVPHDPAVFSASQRFTKLGSTPTLEGVGMTSVAVSEVGDINDGEKESVDLSIPPVLIFPAEFGQKTNLDQFPSTYAAQWERPDRFVTFNPFRSPYHSAVKRGDHSTPAGLYSESVDRKYVDQAEEGFRLLLPFTLRPFGDDADNILNSIGGNAGARWSDGTLVEKGDPTGLFQHGQKPFGGNTYGRAQRLERLFDKWRELVESSIWMVGKDGVDGSIERFREADGLGWRNYWIPPTW
ncbi:hypothetical protein VMCG_07194 [Cytospora schulzeri]|uniref:Uncharacterized protein n=1 Tax=Cytospora schulzeri TaxID=448051 RepID=A0A423W4X3_9PEZI|nr:hypothetical protein VMCG_07194 [Valsa malicola]